MSMNGKKKRLHRTTHQQYQALMCFVESNPCIVNGKFMHTEPGEIHNLWTTFAATINAKSVGPVKTVEQWKRIFTEWKVNTKRKNREILMARRGRGPDCRKKLNELEQRLLTFLSRNLLGGGLLSELLRKERTKGDAEVSLDIKVDQSCVEEAPVVCYSTSEESSNVKPALLGDQSSDVTDMSFRSPSGSDRFANGCDDPVETAAHHGCLASTIKDACKVFVETQAKNVDAENKKIEAIKELISVLKATRDALTSKGETDRHAMECAKINAEANLLRAKAEAVNARVNYFKLMGDFPDI